MQLHMRGTCDAVSQITPSHLQCLDIDQFVSSKARNQSLAHYNASVRADMPSNSAFR